MCRGPNESKYQTEQYCIFADRLYPYPRCLLQYVYITGILYAVALIFDIRIFGFMSLFF